MVPLVCRIQIVLASLLVPRAERKAWKQEWYAELSYRKRSGATLAYMLRSSRGSFRDALWIRKQQPFTLRFLHPPLRVEYLMMAVALLVAVWNSGLTPPRPQYANLDRLVRLQHDSKFMGTNDRRVWIPLINEWSASKDIEQLASYRVYIKPVRYARVTPNFFEVLGVPAVDRGAIGAADDSNSAVVTYGFWRDQLGSNPRAIGTNFRAAGKTFRVSAVLGRGFAFNKCL